MIPSLILSLLFLAQDTPKPEPQKQPTADERVAAKDAALAASDALAALLQSPLGVQYLRLSQDRETMIQKLSQKYACVLDPKTVLCPEVKEAKK